MIPRPSGMRFGRLVRSWRAGGQVDAVRRTAADLRAILGIGRPTQGVWTEMRMVWT